MILVGTLQLRTFCEFPVLIPGNKVQVRKRDDPLEKQPPLGGSSRAEADTAKGFHSLGKQQK